MNELSHLLPRPPNHTQPTLSHNKYQNLTNNTQQRYHYQYHSR